MTDIVSERQRRVDLWYTLAQQDLNDIEPQRLRELGIYAGAQGIWVDKTHTASAETGPDGVTVGILHTGRHYPDDLSDDGVTYHYPKTSRPAARDSGEIQATKNAMIHHLPIFVVLPGKTSEARRSLKLGWVCDFDDEKRQFLILFGDEKPPPYAPAEAPNAPFQLMGEPNKKSAKVLVRRGQQRFRFQVMSKYGYKCAVCDISHPELLKAAHICGIAERGSDDWRNGIPLCPTHHEAFDEHLFCIDPKSGEITCRSGINPKDIGLVDLRFRTLQNSPHVDALHWRWQVTQKEWQAGESKKSWT